MAQLVAVPPARHLRASSVAGPAISADASADVPVALVDDAPLRSGAAHLPSTPADVARAAALATEVRVGVSRDVPHLPAVRAVVDALTSGARAAGRARGDLRIELELEVVVVANAAEARRTSSRLSTLDGLVGLGWSPSASRLVGTREHVEAEAARIGREARVDAVVLVPLGR